MSLNLNPWLALLLGILIGWLLEWLLELWLFRRRRLECQGRLSQVEADLRAKEIELGNVRAHADSLQADLTALSSARRSEVKAELPEVEIPVQAREAERSVNWTAAPAEPAAPRAEVHWPEVGSTVAEVSATLPEAQPLAAEIEAPSIGAELPAATAGAVSVGLPEAAVEVTQPPAGERSVNWTAAPVSPAAGSASACPQDLSKLPGIGTVYEQKLHAAGIGTFWQLSQADEGDLARILGVKDFQKVNLAEIKAAAQQMAEATGAVGRTWDGSQPDDFEPLGGIGQVYEGRLYDAGICTYAALAAATVEQLAEICKAPAWRTPDYATWIAQAAAQLAKGK